ncbi:hypothetical protein HZ994_03800 [Akkermansiaceae bacterium]|nr:hypothetical protein HZ994_03800 [Akkermansiaceae bacterium]
MTLSDFSRRDLLRLATLASLAPISCSPQEKEVPETPREKPGKKGLGIGTKNDGWDQRLKDLRCKWFYSWVSATDKPIPAGIEFIPMVFGRWDIPKATRNAAAFAEKIGADEILGFNEPDQKHQANMSVEKALDAWPLLMGTGLRLGSPGCVHPDKLWMMEFMAGVEERKLRVDFVCIHSYTGPSPAAFIERVESVHEMFRRPIWITEFAVGDWEAKSVETNRHKPERIRKFMEELLPQLEAMDIVERYAWFPAGQDNKALGTSALFDKDGRLTPLGECYRDA